MILSKNTELGEFDVIGTDAHVQKVWAEIEKSLPKYWAKFVAVQPATPGAQLASHFNGTKQAPNSSAVLQAFAAAVQKYEKVAPKYREFFDPDAMEEFADSPSSFKSHLAREVPVIAGTLNQRRPELQEWQHDFRKSRANDLLTVFSNIMDFKEDWAATKSETVFSKFDSREEFGLDELDSDETMTLSSVIGMGIKSIVLFNLDPRIFPQRARTDLYGLYFLSGMNDFGLASESSEFLMINDREPASNGSLIMEHNFWYPYGLFSMYAIRIYRWLDEQVRTLGGALDTKVRYVYVSHFLSAVCAEHTEHMKVMRAHDRFGNPS